MQKYIARRLLLAIPTIFGVTVVIFLVMRVLPGDPLTVVVGMEENPYKWTPEERAAYMEELGLADPLLVQYLNWMKDIGSGSMGEAMMRGDDVSKTILRRAPISAEIAVLGIVLSLLVGIPVGIISAIKPNSAMDLVTRFVTVLFIAVPSFWFALLVVVAGILWFGYKSPVVAAQLWENPWANLQMVIGPATVIGLGSSAFVARLARSALLEVMTEDYVRTARAKGLIERLVVARHALPNALLPVITLIGVFLAAALGGSIAVEKAFVVPGLGKTMVDAAVDRDIPVVQNLVMIYVIIFVMVNLLVDISYARIDPRIRYS